MTCVMTKLCQFANSSLLINGLRPNTHWQGSRIMLGHMVCNVVVIGFSRRSPKSPPLLRTARSKTTIRVSEGHGGPRGK